MLEDKNKQSPNNTSDNPRQSTMQNTSLAPEPEDVFSVVDPVKIEPSRNQLWSSALVLNFGRRKIIIIIAVGIIILLVFAGLAYWYLWGRLVVTSEQVVPSTSNEIINSTPEVVPEMPAPKNFDEDPDADGLTVEQEKVAGTNLESPDTDSDGLFDGEEVRSFGTDPLKPDTDNDGYSDGEEVRRGYNPKGSGKLFNSPL